MVQNNLILGKSGHALLSLEMINNCLLLVLNGCYT